MHGAEKRVDDAGQQGVLQYSDARALRRPGGIKSADVDDSGVLDVRDPLWILLYLFAGGGAPPEPFLACGGDPTPDDLKCASSPVCE